MVIHVAGGVYQENCMHPPWDETYGSAGRAAAAIDAMGTPATLHSYVDVEAQEILANRVALSSGMKLVPRAIPAGVSFQYDHDLATPRINGIPTFPYEPIQVSERYVIRFGMLEGDAVVDAEYAVYDPQNMGSVIPFHSNGSRANHLALVLNQWEARNLSGLSGGSIEDCARALANQTSAEVVVIKRGARGALVLANNKLTDVKAYQSSRVWKIGSGDVFVAHFANAWMHEQKSPVDAALWASKATAYYCETQGFPTRELLTTFTAHEIEVSPSYSSEVQRQVYLAGPFFDLPQRWMIEQAYQNLRDVGLRVFSPFHLIGLGSADDVVKHDLRAIESSDLMFAMVDGLDPGTLYEIGYARALGKPVIVYSERESPQSVKMMYGSSCTICNNYATAIYYTLWAAAKI